MRVALIQMSVTADRARNITAACQHIRRAAEGGADMAVLPEMFCCPYDNGCFRAYGETAGGQRFMESDTLSPGDQITTFDTEFGPMGLCICFDLRFEELSRCMCLRDCQAIVVPAAFNMTTGPAHWELLFRQRAVDNQCFTLGCAPARDEGAGYVSYGNSIAVDPWGTVLCRADEKETILYADLGLSRVKAVRQQLPILSARRTDLYEIREK